MPDENLPESRDTKTKAEIGVLKASISDLIRVQKALITAVTKIENELDIEAMPEGTYHGFKFE